MRSAIIKDLIILLSIFAIVWALFTFIPFLIDRPDVQISIENEEKLGELIVNELVLADHKMKILQNPQIDSAINVILKRINDVSGPTDYNYKITVIENEKINAFALPGGNIFLFSGLIKFAEYPEEVAAVLAHELGHVEKRHVVNKLLKELGISILMMVITGSDNMLTNEIGRTAISTVFDRNQEKEADQFALEVLERAKINPKVMATFFRRLNEKTDTYNENLEILMTHPHNNSRIKASLEYQINDDFNSEKIELDWTKIKSLLKK
jgi:beta-barrel assembly-enhancing protease